MTWYTREINNNLFVLTSIAASRSARSIRTTRSSGNAIASFLLGAPSGGGDRQQLLPDVPLELLRAVGPGRLAGHQSPDAEPRRALGPQHAGVRGGEPPQLRLRHRRRSTRCRRASISSGCRATGARRARLRRRRRQSDSTRTSATRTTSSRASASPTCSNDKTIVRGGYGLYYLNVVSTSASNGFGVRLRPITSLDGDRTSTYRAGAIRSRAGSLEAPGSSLGLETFLGRSPSFSNPDFVNPYVHQFSLGVQRLLPWRTTVELSYVGSRTREMQNRWGGFNEPPLALRNRCDPTQGRHRRHSATSCCRIRSSRCRASKARRGSRARRSRATS